MKLVSQFCCVRSHEFFFERSIATTHFWENAWKIRKKRLSIFRCAKMSMILSTFLITRLVNKFSKQYKQLDRFDIISHTCKCELPTRVILCFWRLLDATAFYCSLLFIKNCLIKVDVKLFHSRGGLVADILSQTVDNLKKRTIYLPTHFAFRIHIS